MKQRNINVLETKSGCLRTWKAMSLTIGLSKITTILVFTFLAAFILGML